MNLEDIPALSENISKAATRELKVLHLIIFENERAYKKLVPSGTMMAMAAFFYTACP